MKFDQWHILHTRMKKVVALIGLTAVLLVPASVAADTYPCRIVSMAPNLTEILYDLGAEDRIVAVTDYCNYPHAAKTKPKIGGFTNPSLEAIVSFQPDYIFMTEDGNPQILHRRLKSMGIRTYIFKARRIQELPQEIRSIGRILGLENQANRKAKWIETQIESIAAAAHAGKQQKTRKAIFIVQPTPLIAAGKGTAIDDAFMILGINNIASAGRIRYPKYSLEAIIRMDPDVLFFGREHGADERIKPLIGKLVKLSAVRSGRIFSIDEAIYRLGPRIVSGIEEIAGCLDAK